MQTLSSSQNVPRIKTSPRAAAIGNSIPQNPQTYFSLLKRALGTLRTFTLLLKSEVINTVTSL